MVLSVPIAAHAEGERLVVVVRQGPRDATIVARLRGQLADLDEVALTVEPIADGIEPTLEGQLAAAERIAVAHDARVVVWVVARGRSLAVAIATPREHRLFVREIPAAEDSSMAEAAAITVRGAVRSIAQGGTIGVEATPAVVEPPPPATPTIAGTPAAATTMDAAIGWQVTLDGGAEHGAHALAQRTTLARGAWGASLAITLGMPLSWRAANDVTLEIARSSASLGAERRVGGGIALGIAAGAIVYHRSTSMAPSGLSPTPSSSTVAFAAGLEVMWRAHLTGALGIVACAGVDLVLGAPEAVVARDAKVEVLDAIHAVQPRFTLALEVRPW
ncbi:hypothetical protein BH11MYX3_BH11MYX3_44920 [soil metagenome]